MFRRPKATFYPMVRIIYVLALDLLIIGVPFAVHALPGIKCGTIGIDANGQALNGSENCLIPCDGSDANPCTFTSLMELANNVILYLIYISIPLAAISFTYAGWLFITAGGNPRQISQAWSIFRKVAIGLIFILSAWLIVKTVTDALIYPEFSPLKK
jgi:hypothetical protein